MKPRILITGGSGLLALNWYAAIRDRFEVVLAMHERKLELNDAVVQKLSLDSVETLTASLKTISPSLVVHTAGCTSVETCEQKPALAQFVNVALAENVAKACTACGVPLVHISTDHLFTGAKALGTEDFPASPLNVYGQTKAEAETRVLAACPEALVIRTNFYGWGTSYRKSFSDVILAALRQQQELNLFDDVFYTPILADELVRTVHDLTARKASGIFNVVGSERLTKYEFGLRVAEAFDLDASRIRRGTLTEQKGLVRRPYDMSLSNSKTSALLGRELGSVSTHLKELRHQEQQGRAMELRKL